MLFDQDVLCRGRWAYAFWVSGTGADGRRAVCATPANPSAASARFFVYGGVIFSMLTAVIYSIKGGAAIKQAVAHPEDEDIDFLNPEIED